MCVWICVSSATPDAAIPNARTAQSRYAARSRAFSGNPSRSAGSSIWIIPMPAFSRSSVSCRSASAICKAVVARGWSSRTNDHCSIVTGPVSMPFTGFALRLCAYDAQPTVIGSGKYTSP